MKSTDLPLSARRGAAMIRLWLAAVVCWGAASACTSSGGSTNNPTDSKILSCTSHEECATLVPAQQCDFTRRECVCTTDLMCPAATPYCNVITGRCVEKLAGCNASSCETGQYCDPSTRTCKPLREFCEGCDNDAECGSGNRCITHPDFQSISRTFCAKACGAGYTCEDGLECRDTIAGTKQCVPKGALCSGDVKCEPDLFTACENDSQCTASAGQKCDTTIKKCVAATTVCAPGQSCDPRTRSCVAECATDDQCKARLGDDFICLQRACRPANECTKDEQCATTQFCIKESSDPNALGRCTATCQIDDECPIGKRCIQGASGRKSCVTSCAGNSDCQLNEVCRAGTCEGGHCQVKAVCGFAENCISDNCVKETHACDACSGTCAGGGKCKPVFFYGACGPTSCPPGSTQVCAVDGSCGSQQACYCQINRCLLPCAVDAECAQGFSCITLPDGNYCVPEGDGQYCLTPP